MDEVEPHDDEWVTRTLTRLAAGDARAADELLPLVYDELRRIAGGYFRREAAAHTLEPTALVHEAYARLAGQSDARYRDATHFRAIASQAMRRVLVDHARRRGAAKRDGGERVTLSGVDTSDAAPVLPGVDVLALDEALGALAALSERQARIVELRFFGGLTVEESAAVLDVSPRTVKADWRVARAWLQRALG